MATSHNPTTHGAWRVIDGQLVDESTLPQPPVAETTPTPAASESPASPVASPSPRRKAPTHSE